MSGCKKILEHISEKFHCKVWVCKKVGRRISFINDLKAGIEKFEPPQVICEDDRYVVLAQVEKPSSEMVELCWKVIDCVRRCFEENPEPSGKS
ncbi:MULTISPECIES: hypothetical protein [Pseudothermotoga]|jgi:hypothetical protein|uniref:hypothetical protein n=1 Tax=Pseudothermotoga TaxID=1643951 RepID=UPI0004184013|nr:MULTISPECIES: hypothetical protein [Pseudothermotoga]HBJ80898.1 hypothetical protein [Pseudothermotoga sp.]